MVITVAICTWNRCQLLRKTLEQFTQVTIPPDVEVDLLVVNNNCTDDTPTVVDAFRHRLPVRTLLEPAPGLSHARNAALSASSSDYIVFTDDDVLVDKSWLVELVAAARVYPTAAVIGGVIEPWFPVEPDAEFQEVFPWLKGGFCGLNHGAERALLPTGRFVYGANMAFRMDRVAGMRFSPQLGTSPTSAVGGEEREFMARLQASGESIVWWPQMMVQHYVEPQRMLLPYLLAFSAGKGKEWVFFRGRDRTPRWFGVPRWLWRRRLRAGVACAAAHVLPYAGAAPRDHFSGEFRRDMTRRVRTLLWRRELAFLSGMSQGYRQDAELRGMPDLQTVAPTAPHTTPGDL